MLKKFFTSPYIILFAAAFLFYCPALFNGFVWDDFMLFAANTFVHHAENLKYLFSRQYLTSPQDVMFMTCQNMIGSGEGVYRPVTTLSYFIDYGIWKLNPFGYHLTNIILHALCACLVYRLIRDWVPSAFAALVGTLFFVAHPLQMEAVVVPSMRDDLLALVFYLAAIRCYLAYREHASWKFHIGLLIFFVLAVFSKEMAFTLPAMLWVVEVYRPIRPGEKKVPFLQDVFARRYWVIYGVGIACLFIWMFVMHRPDGFALKYPGDNLLTAFLTMIRVMGTYISWIVNPLSIHHTVYGDDVFIIRSWGNMQLWTSVLKIMGLVLVVIWLRRRMPLLGFSVLWTVIAFLPASGVLPMENILGARFLYLPSVGMAIAAAVIWDFFEKREGFVFNSGLSLGRAILGALAFFYLLTTWSHVLRLKNNFSFQYYLVQNYPQHPKAHNGLASVYYWDKKDPQKAIEHALTADRLDPGYVPAHQLLALIYAEQGNYAGSLRFNRKMFELMPERYVGYLRQYWNQFLQEFPGFEDVGNLSCEALADKSVIEMMIQDPQGRETAEMAESCRSAETVQ